MIEWFSNRILSLTRVTSFSSNTSSIMDKWKPSYCLQPATFKTDQKASLNPDLCCHNRSRWRSERLLYVGPKKKNKENQKWWKLLLLPLVNLLWLFSTYFLPPPLKLVCSWCKVAERIFLLYWPGFFLQSPGAYGTVHLNLFGISDASEDWNSSNKRDYYYTHCLKITLNVSFSASFRFSKTRQTWPFLAFWINFWPFKM